MPLAAFAKKGIFPYAGFKFAFFEKFKHLHFILKKKKEISNFENLIYGGGAGCCAVTITYPTDLLRRKRQVQIITGEAKNGSYLDLIKGVYRREGYRGFYHGLQATYYKVIPSTAFMFAINEFLKKKLIH